MSISVGKFIGCVMMVVGSSVGAGILAMPMACAHAGFSATIVTMLFLWILQTITGLLIVEASLSFPDHACTFNSITARLFGPFGRAVTWVSYLLLLYTTLIAYIAGGPDLIVSILKYITAIDIPRWVITTLFTFILAISVFWSTKATDNMNRALISVKGLLLVTTLLLLITSISLPKLLALPNVQQLSSIFIASPVLLTLFNYHFVIPSIRMYVGNRPAELKWIIISGTSICLVIYLFWLAPILSIVPLDGGINSFSAIGGNPGELSRVLVSLTNNKLMAFCICGFTNITMTTAFLGISLGLFDFLADGLRRPNTRVGRLQTACLTFLPPLGINLLLSNPDSFLQYFSCSGAFVAILFLFLPPLMVYRIRKNPELASVSPYRMKLGNGSFIIIAAIGIIFTILPIAFKYSYLFK